MKTISFLIYVVLIVPVGLLLKLFGVDYLRTKKNKTVNSLWINK